MEDDDRYCCESDQILSWSSASENRRLWAILLKHRPTCDKHGQTDTASLAQLVLMSSRQTCLHTCGFLAREVVLETARFIFESVLRVTYASGTVVFGVTGRPLFIRRCHLVLAGPVIFWVQLRSALTTHNIGSIFPFTYVSFTIYPCQLLLDCKEKMSPQKPLSIRL